MSSADFSRYHRIVAELAQRSLAAAPEPPPSAPGRPVSILHALPAARLLLADDAAHHAGLALGLSQMASLAAGPPGPADSGVVDPAGHSREVYHPFALHLCLAAFARRYESMPASLWSRCQSMAESAVAPMRLVESCAGIAPEPEQTALTLWRALALADAAVLLGRDLDMELIDAVVHAVVRRPGPEGSLHPRLAEQSLDAWTYRELTGLHALAGLALLRRNQGWARRVEEVAMHHVENTQPDNTTNQPWALFGFAWSMNTRSFADQQIHDATAHAAAWGSHHASTVGPLAGMLLADAADALGRFAQGIRDDGSDRRHEGSSHDRT